MSNLSYIAIDGLICTGKTHLTALLSEKLNASPVYEPFDQNPFIEKFYAQPKQFSFPAELFFLISRHQQLTQFVQTDLFEQSIISDYMFEKNRIFASVTLNEQELTLYFKISELLIQNLPKPDLIIYLQSDIAILMERIKGRARDFERTITPEYLRMLNEAYNTYLFKITDVPVMVLNVNNMNFEKDSEDFNWLVEEIQKPFSGLKYLNPKQL